MLANIRVHSYVVTRVAECLLANLVLPDVGGIEPPGLDLVRAGALLHDIAKTKCLDGSCRHAEEGRLICEVYGYPEVGTIVAEHVILSSFSAEQYRRGQFTAREIVYYADKRVRHDEIVNLPDRLDYIIERYGNGSSNIEARIRENFQHCLELENYLFSFLPFRPENLSDHVNQAPF